MKNSCVLRFRGDRPNGVETTVPGDGQASSAEEGKTAFHGAREPREESAAMWAARSPRSADPLSDCD
jgi:hypothetical protein